MTLQGHTRGVTCLFQISENVLASGSSDKTIKVGFIYAKYRFSITNELVALGSNHRREYFNA